MNPKFLACAAALIPFTTQGAVVLFFSTSASFNASIGSNPQLGTENWEESNLSAGQVTSFNDSLSPGVANANFPSGTGTAAGITAQSNTGGATSTSTSPRGAGGLATASVGYLGTPSDQVSPTQFGDGFDLIINPASGAAWAVSLSPLYFNLAANAVTSNAGSGIITVYDTSNIATATSNAGSVIITVYDTSNALMGSQTINSVDYSGTAFLGIQAVGALPIGRINLYATSDAANSNAGADNIAVFAPEPSAAAMIGLGLLATAPLLRRKKA